MRVCRRAILTILTAGIVGSGAAASAQTPEQFYTGKTIDLVIGYPPGGSNDTLGRLLARHLGKHIPGNPTLVPKNQPGAGSFLAVNTIFNVSPKDGTVIGIGAPTIPLDEKLGTHGVRFKTAELNWIGRLDSLTWCSCGRARRSKPSPTPRNSRPRCRGPESARPSPFIPPS